MKKYTLSFVDSLDHIPEFPERTACKTIEWDVVYRVWPSAASMEKSLEIQGRRAPRFDDWKAWKPKKNKSVALAQHAMDMFAS